MTRYWIQEAIKRPGALRKALHAVPGKPLSKRALARAAKATGRLGKQARLALMLRGFNEARKTSRGGVKARKSTRRVRKR